MLKKYKSKLRGYNLFINVNGVSKDIEFKKGFVISSLIGCVYITDDKATQEAIEAHPEFNDKFWTDNKEEVVVDAKEEAHLEPKKVKRYKTKE